MSEPVRLLMVFVAALALFVGVGRLRVDSDGPGVTSDGAAEVNTFRGRPRVRDGDSLEFPSVQVRLFGVDAFELEQRCRGLDDRIYPCGHVAKRALESLVHGRNVVCHERDRDQYGRVVAVCRVGDTDVGAEQVRAGLALAYRHYSKAYIPFERDARDARRGAWVGKFENPWDWRRSRR